MNEKEIGKKYYNQFLVNMTEIQEGYKEYYYSMMEWNIAFDHDEFWVGKVERAVSAYSGYA